MLARKGYDNHHCQYKPPDKKWGWSVDDVMPGRDGPEDFEKESVDIGPWRQRIEFLPLRHRVEIGPLRQELNFDR